MLTAREMKPIIIEAVREVIREEIIPRLDKLEENVEKFSDMKDMLLEQQKAITEIKDSLDFTENQINGICNKIIPDLDKKYGDLITNLCMNILDMDTHRRKWSIIINGIQGEAGEAERLTRSKAHSFACNKLKIPGADSHSFAACHRLAQNEILESLLSLMICMKGTLGWKMQKILKIQKKIFLYPLIFTQS